jgi:isopentenyl-diphosphate Delta-isomerase
LYGVPDGDEFVTLVDADDNVVGTGEKLRVHRDGTLHRAFSIFVFDTGRQLLLQRRARHKYHSASLWSNTCCGHPRPGEATDAAAARRLTEEMGFACDLSPAFRTLYRAELPGAMVEHEVDQVLIGMFDGTPSPDPLEVDEYLWLPLDELRRRIAAAPADYTVWLKLLLANDYFSSPPLPLKRSSSSANSTLKLVSEP